MSTLEDLIELQSIHENLRTIARDLSDFPSDLAGLDGELKKLAKRKEELGQGILESEKKVEALSADLKVALRLEEHARAAVKQTSQKAQYTAAIRELDDRERHRNSIAKPLKEWEGKLAALREELQILEETLAQKQGQFDELHHIFLSEHETQVEGRARLGARLKELETTMEGSELTRFQKLFQMRQGRAVVAVENGNCGGCRTKIRVPLMSQIREKGFLQCEFCQRILYIHSK